jgi:RNA polymerase sigma factor (sigma-70 family)
LESFEKLAEQFTPMIHHIINSLHISDKDEFYQQGLIALWEASYRFDPQQGHFASYAYSFIKGRLLNLLAKMSNYREKCFCPKEEFWNYHDELTIDHPLEWEFLQSYCETMTPNQRKWVHYTFRDDLSINEVAEREKVTPSAVKQWRSGAKDKVRKFMKVPHH